MRLCTAFRAILTIFILCNAVQLACAKDQLAVMDLKGKYGVEDGLAAALSDIVRAKIHSLGKYEVLSTQDIEAIAKRESIQMKIGCDSEELQCLLDFGNNFGTEFMVAGEVSKLGDTYVLSLRLLDTKGDDAGVKGRKMQKCTCDEGTLIDAAELLAASVMGVKTGDPLEKNQTQGTLGHNNESETAQGGWLGVGIQDFTPEMREYFNIKDRGVLVTRDMEGSPAYEAGIRRGDVILSVNGQDVRVASEAARRIADSGAGSNVEISYIQRGQSKTANITLAQRDASKIVSVPGNTGQEQKTQPYTAGRLQLPQADRLGLQVTKLDRRNARKFGYELGETGVLIVGVVPKGVAAGAGVREGSIINEMNRKPVRNLNDYSALLRQTRADEPISLLLRMPNSGYVVVQIKPQQ